MKNENVIFSVPDELQAPHEELNQNVTPYAMFLGCHGKNVIDRFLVVTKSYRRHGALSE
jgi:hypothetical protein